ncbi:MAG TPA: zf-TFIIB domain-containing protein [Kiritimatiellia bacterium]|nr:zf-TFIIB domain-containing protein [Kiritimatiellia bacterium]
MISRDCPICAAPLEQETYEGFPIWRCPECHGTLLDFSRYEAIQSIPDTSLAELEAEAQAGFQGDNPNRIRCPRCRGVMDKRPLRVPGFENLHLDFCRGCDFVWLDGGELALAQLAYQATPAFREKQEMKRRAAERDADPGRKAAFDEALAKLPDPPGILSETFREALFDALRTFRGRGRLRL